MKSFVVALLFAAVAAEDGYTCVDTDPSTWNPTDLSSVDVTTSEECKAACDTAVAAGDPVTNDNDWCCSSVAVTEPASLTCTIHNIATAGADIRAESADADGTTSSAWAWEAGVASADLTVVEEPAEEPAAEDDATEDDEDMSVRMTASAVAAASIAMLAM